MHRQGWLEENAQVDQVAGSEWVIEGEGKWRKGANTGRRSLSPESSKMTRATTMESCTGTMEWITEPKETLQREN